MYDLFVSYARVDNLDSGWVDSLVALLRSKLRTLLPSDPGIYFDKREEQIGANVPQDLLDAADGSRILLVVLSPRYLASKWCRAELQKFLGRPRAPRSVFVIEAESIDRGEWPEPLRSTHTIELWQRNPDTGRATRLDPQFGSEYAGRFTRTVYEIGHMVAERLKVKDDFDQPPPKGTVWIAPATDDLAEEREKLAAAVRQKRWEVLPRSSHYRHYDHDPALFKAAVESDLREARLFVQLLGPYKGQCPDWSESSFTQLQSTLAAGYAAKRDVRWLRWRTKNALELAPPGQYAELLRAGDVQESTPGDFTAEVIRCLTLLEAPPPPRPPNVPGTDREAVVVYVHNDVVDEQLAAEIRECLGTFDDIMAFGAPQLTLRNQLRQTVKHCDGVILAYGTTAHEWVVAQCVEILKALAAVRPIGLVNGPPEQWRPPIAGQAVLPLDCHKGVDRAEIAKFVDSIRRRGRNGGDHAESH